MPSRKFKTTTYETVVEMVGKGMNFEAIARETGCNPHHLRSAACVFGIKSAYGARASADSTSYAQQRIAKAAERAKREAERNAVLRECIKTGATLAQIANRLGVSKGMACRYRQIWVALNSGVDIDRVHEREAA